MLIIGVHYDKKYVLFLAIGLTLLGNAKAVTPEDFKDYLDITQKTYPIVEKLRDEELFKQNAMTLLSECPEKSAEEILFLSFYNNLNTYINRGDNNNIYYKIIENMVPLYMYLTENYAPPIQNS